MRIDDVLPTPKLYKLDGTLQLHIAKEGNNPQVSEAFLKPSMPGIFWTSTAKQNKDGNYSSEWSDGVKLKCLNGLIIKVYYFKLCQAQEYYK